MNTQQCSIPLGHLLILRLGFLVAGEPGRISDELVPVPEGPDDGCV